MDDENDRPRFTATQTARDDVYDDITGALLKEAHAKVLAADIVLASGPALIAEHGSWTTMVVYERIAGFPATLDDPGGGWPSIAGIDPTRLGPNLAAYVAESAEVSEGSPLFVVVTFTLESFPDAYVAELANWSLVDTHGTAMPINEWVLWNADAIAIPELLAVANLRPGQRYLCEPGIGRAWWSVVRAPEDA